jgi:hypothetical protein
MSGNWRVIVTYRYGAAAFVYAVFVLLGSVGTQRHPEGSYIAAATLVKDHRITSGDLRRPSRWPFAAGWYLPDRSAMEGKYLVSGPINACQDVAPSSVQVAPDFQIESDLKLVVLPLPAGSQLPRILDAGSIVELLSSKKPEPENTAPSSKVKPKAGEKKGTAKTDGASEKKSDGGGDSSVQASKTAKVHAILCDAPTGQDKSQPMCYVALAVPAAVEEYVTKEKDSIRLVPKALAARDTCKEGAKDGSADVAKDRRTTENP